MLALRKIENCTNKNVAIRIASLLSAHSDLNLLDASGDSVLHLIFRLAASYKDLDFLALRLLDKGMPNVNLSITDANGDSPLHWAMKHDHYKLVESFLSVVASVKVPSNYSSPKASFLNAQDRENGDTILILAMKLQLEDLACFMLDHGCSADIGSNNWLSLSPSEKTAADGARVDADICNDLPIHIAIKSRMLKLSTHMISANVDLTKKDTLGFSCLHLAVLYGMLPFIAKLGTANLDSSMASLILNAKDTGSDADALRTKIVALGGDTPLQLALRCRQVEIACGLLDAGSDPNERNANGETFLHVLAKVLPSLVNDMCSLPQVRAIGMVHGLMKTKRADARARTIVQDGLMTPLHVLVRQTSHENKVIRANARICAVAFLKHDCELANECDRAGDTVLCSAIKLGEEELSRIAIDAGCMLDQANMDGNTAAHLAIQHHLPSLMQVLAETKCLEHVDIVIHL